MSAKSRGGVGRKEKKVQGAADERAWGVSDTRQRVRGSSGLAWAELGVRFGPSRPEGEGEVVLGWVGQVGLLVGFQPKAG